MARIAAVFVHGILSSGGMWQQLHNLLNKDPAVQEQVDLITFPYSSPRLVWNPLKRVPELTNLGQRLNTFLKEDARASCARSIILIGHSQGGLVIQQFVASKLMAGQGDELRRISACLLFATPNNGSQFLLSLRKSLSALGFILYPFYNSQEKFLRPLDEHIAQLQRTIIGQAVYARTASPSTCPIHFSAYAGEEDNVVRSHSAHWVFPEKDIGTLPGDHSSIVRPKEESADICKIIRKAFRRAQDSCSFDDITIRTQLLGPGDRSMVDEFVQLDQEYFGGDHGITYEDMHYWIANYEETFGIKLRLLTAMIGDDPRSFLMFHEDSKRKIIVVDYFAAKTHLEKAHREHNFESSHARSSDMLNQRRQALVDTLASSLLIERLRQFAMEAGIARVIFEAECPQKDAENEQECKARVQLFRRYGARFISGVNYVAPSMNRAGVFSNELPHYLLYGSFGRLPDRLSRAEVEEIVRYLYLVWYRNWMSRTHSTNMGQLDKYLESLAKTVTDNLQEPHLLLRDV